MTMLSQAGFGGIEPTGRSREGLPINWQHSQCQSVVILESLSYEQHLIICCDQGEGEEGERDQGEGEEGERDQGEGEE